MPQPRTIAIGGFGLWLIVVSGFVIYYLAFVTQHDDFAIGAFLTLCAIGATSLAIGIPLAAITARHWMHWTIGMRMLGLAPLACPLICIGAFVLSTEIYNLLRPLF